jgi:hypothetical protein
MHMQMNAGVHHEENMMTSFADFTKDFRNSSATDTNRKPTRPKPRGFDPETKHRQLIGQISGIIQELLNLPELSDSDRRILSISSAVAFLLSGGR